MSATSDLACPSTVLPRERRVTKQPTWGPVLCLLAAVLYTGTNMALRRLADPTQAADATFVLFVKETITVLLVGPWLFLQIFQRRMALPSSSHFSMMLAAGILTQTVANLGLIWAFGTVGIAIAIPLSLAVSLITAAWLGKFWLREALSARIVMAMLLLIVGIVLLQGGANPLQGVVNASPATTATAVFLSCLAGVIYGLLTVVIRQVTTGGTSGWFVLLIVTGSATVTLGPYIFLAHGPQVFITPAPEQWLWMTVSGILNFAAFWALTKGLQRTPVARANLLTSSQAAMATIAGWIVFGETLNLQVGIGILLALLAICLSTLR